MMVMRAMSKYLQIASGILGLIAAVLWFLAARRQPAPGHNFGYSVRETRDSPFQQKWRAASRLNEWAAGVTGLSVLLSAACQFVPSD
jgi:hypothetical protein